MDLVPGETMVIMKEIRAPVFIFTVRSFVVILKVVCTFFLFVCITVRVPTELNLKPNSM